MNEPRWTAAQIRAAAEYAGVAYDRKGVIRLDVLLAALAAQPQPAATDGPSDSSIILCEHNHPAYRGCVNPKHRPALAAGEPPAEFDAGLADAIITGEQVGRIVERTADACQGVRVRAAGEPPAEPSPEAIARIIEAGKNHEPMLDRFVKRMREAMTRAQVEHDAASNRGDEATAWAFGRIEEILTGEPVNCQACFEYGERRKLGAAAGGSGVGAPTPATHEPVFDELTQAMWCRECRVPAEKCSGSPTPAYPVLDGPHVFMEYGSTGRCGWIRRHGGPGVGPTRCVEPADHPVHGVAPTPATHEFVSTNGGQTNTCRSVDPWCNKYADHPVHGGAPTPPAEICSLHKFRPYYYQDFCSTPVEDDARLCGLPEDHPVHHQRDLERGDDQ